ncbi:MAG: MazG family protein [Verrucomicrobiae bacterium]|nr:MazG family protein [Verrucomicrobiae bacterium]
MQIKQLLRIMTRLRSRHGCPWDREQTHQSIIRCLKSESREVIRAIENNDYHNLQEELGDLLLQVVFHSQLAREAGKFTFNDVVRTLNRKLVRRHPHVFGKSKARTSEEVLKQWADIKAREKKQRKKSCHSANA